LTFIFSSANGLNFFIEKSGIFFDGFLIRYDLEHVSIS